MGLEAVIDGEPLYVGNAALMEKVGAEWHECHLSGTVTHLARKGEYLGHIVISDELKPDAAAAVAALRTLGVKEPLC